MVGAIATRARIAAAALTASLACLAPIAAVALEPSPALKAVIDAAQKEGKLELQAPGHLMGTGDEVQVMAKGMNGAYGTKIAVSFVPGPPSVPQMLDNIATSQKAGLPSPSGIFIAPTELIGAAWKRGMLVPVDWAALLPGRIDDKIIESEGTALRAYTTLPGGIIYNTQLAPMKPTRLSDLLAPEWKGKIASTPYAASFDLLGASDRWGEEKALDFARKMSKQISGLIGCTDNERIASGEFIAFAMDCTGRDWVQYKRAGAPIEFVVPADNAVRRYYYWGLPKNAAHPNAAKLFITYLMTPEGQRILWQKLDTDLDSFADSGMAKVVADYEKQGLKFEVLTVDWFQKHPELVEMRSKTVKIMTSGG
jgi:ABC-type Fe3+ transport system substrate-binding protein